MWQGRNLNIFGSKRVITRQCADCSFGTTVAGPVAVNCPLAVYPGGLPKSKNVWLVNFGSWTSGQKGTCHSGTPGPLHLGLNYSDWIWLLKPFRHFALQHDTSTNKKLKKPEGFNFRRFPGQGEGELILLLWDQTCACWIVGRGSFLISILLVDVAHPSLVLLNLKLYFCRFHSNFQFHTKLHISIYQSYQCIKLGWYFARSAPASSSSCRIFDLNSPPPESCSLFSSQSVGILLPMQLQSHTNATKDHKSNVW